jgi:hypothetical protein
MDNTITCKEVKTLLSVDVPAITGHLRFYSIQALQKYLQGILEQIPNLQHAKYGWSGLVMSAVMYDRSPTKPRKHS